MYLQLLLCPLLVSWIILLHTCGHSALAEQEIDGAELAKVALPSDIHRRVIGGESMTNQKLGGYLVALRYRGEFICGGTLINDRIVVSAAHCFIGRGLKNQWIIEGNISTLSETGVRVGLVDVVRPAAFREDDMHMDVAVLLLRKPIRGKSINPLSLCSKHLPAGEHLRVSGWGLIDPNASTPHMHLRSVVVPILQKKQCKKTYRASVFLTDSMFCAGVLGQKDACTFDSGGPMVYGKQLCGIVSFGIGCASHKFPGVYTDVYYVRPFIEKTMASLLKRK
ncbi:seminase [Scaptodrosophila lebanonensis]|uniref:Seminase n=1 Tax=Drosophila lebanonensis TaxID=7225 RepID=A0A6J2UC81_DROLE|nr:seminase [Scaptodrosophila lebanonensis]